MADTSGSDASSTLEARIKLVMEGLDQLKALHDGLLSLVSAATQGGSALGSLSAKTDASIKDIGGLGAQTRTTSSTTLDAANAIRTETSALVDSVAATDKKTAASKAAGEAEKALGDAAKNNSASFSAQGVSLDGLSQGVSSLSGYIKAAALAFVGFMGLMSLKNAADQAASVETLGVTLDVVGKNAGYTTENISKYEGELKKLGITTSASRQSMVQMMQAGLDLGSATVGTTSRIGEMARAAQDLAVVTGENSSATLQRLITNISQMDTEGLRWMGIVINMDEAQAKYAASIGKTAGALTTAEKQQAVFNASMDKAKGLSGAYEASMNTVGKQLASMSRYQEEAAVSIGNSLLPAYGELVKAATAALKQVQQTAEEIDKAGVVSANLAEGMKTVLDFGAGVISAISEAIHELSPVIDGVVDKFKAAFSGGSAVDFLGIIQDGIGTVAEFGKSIWTAVGNAAPQFAAVWEAASMLVNTVLDLVDVFVDLTESMAGSTNGTSILKTVLESVGLIIALMADGIRVVAIAFTAMSAGALVGLGGITGALGQILSIFTPFGDEIIKIGDTLIDMGMKAAASARTQTANFVEVGSAADNYGKKLTELKNKSTEIADAETERSKATNAGWKEAEDKVAGYTRKVLEHKLTGDAAKQAAVDLQKELAGLATQYGFNQKQIETLNKRMTEAVEKSDITAGALKNMKLTAGELKDGISEAGKISAQAFTDLAASGKYASDQLYNVFKRGIDTETTLNGLKSFREGLNQAFKDGSMKYVEFASGVSLVNAKFDELLTKGMKTAKTQADFIALREDVIKLGTSGTISSAMVSLGLAKIKEQANGTRAALQLIAKQDTESAVQANSLASATLAVAQAKVRVASAEVDVVRARNKYNVEGTAESKADLKVKEATLVVVKAQAEASISQSKLEVELMRQKRMEQQLSLATKKAEMDVGNVNLQAEVEVSKQRVEKQALLVEAGKQDLETKKGAVIAAQELVAQTELEKQELLAGKAALDGQVESMDKVHAKGAQAIQTYAYASVGAILAIQKNTSLMEASLKNAGATGNGLKDDAESIGNAFSGGVNSIDDWWLRADAIDRAIKSAAESSQRMEAEAQAIKDSYAKIRDNVEATLPGIGSMGAGMGYVGSASTAVRDAMKEIQRDAQAAAKSALDAARSFSSSTSSLYEELLTAQGKETEAIQYKYEQRKKDLALQYQLLQVQLQIAEVQAKAAKLDTSAISAAMAQAKKDLADSLSYLTQLEKIDLDKKKASDAEKAASATKEATSESKAVTSATGGQADTAVTGSKEYNAYLTDLAASAAKNTSGGVASTVPAATSQMPANLGELKLTAGGKTSTIYTSDSTDLLATLKAAGITAL